MEFRKHLISRNASVRDAMGQLNTLAADAILFVVEAGDILMGSLTDGDIRRGFINGFSFDTPILDFIQPHPLYIRKNSFSVEELEEYRKRNLKVIPIVDDNNCIINIINLRLQASMLPVEAVIMAGGRGERLMPLTSNCPKPLLKVGDRPIIELNVDRLINYGVNRIIISIRYLGEQIVDHFTNKAVKAVNIEYIEEDKPLGTFGALGLINDFVAEDILLMNSDLLTNIDFADLYKTYIETDADLIIASIPYHVKVPYAVLEISDGEVVSFDEKPTYSYYSNGGIYLFKKELLQHIEKGVHFDATDFMELLIQKKKRVTHYPILGYWLDIGRHEDFEKAQQDIKHVKF